MSLHVDRFDIDGPLLVTPEVFTDARGRFFDAFNKNAYAAAGIDLGVAQTSHSVSRAGVLRGLHLQHPVAQPKLVRVVRGHIFDVAVDVRRNSPTCGQWVAVELGPDSPRCLYIPAGFAHGFFAHEESEVIYELGAPYDPQGQLSILWNDPELAIDWPADFPILSARDAAAPPFAEVLAALE